MFYRRKLLLSLLEIFGNELEKIRLQKLLFLLTKKQVKQDYEFVPYKFGCYSFSANADLTAMVKKGLITETDSSFRKNDNISYFELLKPADKKLINDTKELYGNMNSNSLMKHTYINHPFWAIKSIVAKDILTPALYQRVEDAKPKIKETILYTIGYEGISLENYFLKLLSNDVKVLVDVRRNPLSMKFGFSKTLLQRYCKALEIEYIHFPEVGIHSNERQELNSQNDYDKLFHNYKSENLPKTIDTQNQIIDILERKHRIALTCFEANICQCHRKHLAEAIILNPRFKYKMKHI
jgi:uncharacterized protein (DUF488 family)